MGKIAFLYPGQGSQRVGMGNELLTVAPELFARYLGKSDVVTGQPITRYCLEGPASVLSQTQIAQPALFTYSLALTEYAQRLGLYPDMVAGHSLGEYTAAVVVGTLSFEDGLHLVSQRGKLMQQIQGQQPGAMAAVIGLPAEVLQDLCADISRQHFVTVTNWNTHMQLVVSGEESGVLELIKAVRGYDMAKAVRLPVKGAFHSRLMQPVQFALEAVMQDLSWHNAAVPLVANVSGATLTKGQMIRQELTDQIVQPVRWATCIEMLLEAGCDTFIEMGSSQVLTRLMSWIAPDKKAVAVDTPAKVVAVAKALHENEQAALIPVQVA